jgi:predicted dehydrogenase
MSAPLKIGIVGAGSIGIRGALEHLVMPDVHDRVIMTAVCDNVPGRAKAAAEKYGVPQYFEDYEQMLKEADIDAVTLGTPIGIHYEQGLKAIRAGKHVHFNKTMTTTVAEADHLIEEAAKAGVKLVSCPGEMIRPHNRRIREMIQEGVIGDVVWAAAGAAFGSYHENEGVRKGDDVLSNVDPTWYWRKAAGGGPLYDMTVYSLHALTGILGPAKAVAGMSGVRIKEREFQGKKYVCDAHDNSLMVLDFGDAIFAFVYGTAVGSLTQGFAPTIFGTKGSIAGLNLNGQPFDYPGREIAMKAKHGNQAILPHAFGRHGEIEETHVYEDIMQLVDLVLDGKPTPSTPEHARHVIEIIEGAYRSAETGETVKLRTTFEMI